MQGSFGDAQFIQRGVVDTERRLSRSAWLEQQPDLVERLERVPGQQGLGAIAAVVLPDHQPVAFEARQSLADRRLRDAEIAGQHIDRHPAIRRDVAVEDQGLERFIGVIGQHASRERFGFNSSGDSCRHWPSILFSGGPLWSPTKTGALAPVNYTL